MSSDAVHITTRIAVHAIARVTTRITVHVIALIVTAYTDTTKRHREAIFVDLCTLLYPHDHPHNWTKPWVYDIDGSMVPVMPGHSDLRPTPLKQ